VNSLRQRLQGQKPQSQSTSLRENLSQQKSSKPIAARSPQHPTSTKSRTQTGPMANSAAVTAIKRKCQLKASEDEAFYRPDSSETRTELTPKIIGLIQEAAKEENHPFTDIEMRQLCQELLDEIYGLGPLEYLMDDDTITDILVNGYDRIFVERFGKLELTDLKFISKEHLLNKVERILYNTGRRVDEASPMVDTRLPDGSRVNIIIPPLGVDGVMMSIRRFPKRHLRDRDLIEKGTITEPMYKFLKIAVEKRLNILVSGGTGSGKTTTLNLLSGMIPDDERIVTIEDNAELRLQQHHVVRLESRPANTEGVGEITQRDLLRNSLRMRPDRIVVGEVRGSEVLDMLQSMNSGHDGSMATIHANNPRDSLSRLELMIHLSGVSLTDDAIRRQVVSALDLIIQITRGKDGVRRMTNITELTGIDNDNILMQDIFTYTSYSTPKHGKSGIFKATGMRPACMDESDLGLAGTDIFNSARGIEA
jgi:pilus assembly protein CpaF